jgi:uncharacterized protein YggU (UPF0235/DUF167 family)
MIIKVKVNTNSKKETLEKTSEDSYTVRMNVTREKGLANKKLLQILARHFNIPQTNVKILHGHSTTHKIVEIEK